MDSREVIVLAASLLTIVAILWYFFGEREKVAASVTDAGVQKPEARGPKPEA
jgi:hypothetical protein